MNFALYFFKKTFGINPEPHRLRRKFMNCVECGKETDINQGTEKNPLCPICYLSLQKTYQDNAAAEKSSIQGKPESFNVGRVLGGVGIGIIGIFLMLFLCGNFFKDQDEAKPTIYNSSYDGSVRQVKEYIKENLNDPESCKFITWSNVTDFVNQGDTTYQVFCKFRAKNAFGAYVLESKRFLLNKKGEIINVYDSNWKIDQ